MSSVPPLDEFFITNGSTAANSGWSARNGATTENGMLFLLDDVADHGVPCLVHEMDFAAHAPIAEHAGRLVVGSPLGFENAPDAARRRRDHRIGNIERHDAEAAGGERIEQLRDIGAQLFRCDGIRREPCRCDCLYRHWRRAYDEDHASSAVRKH